MHRKKITQINGKKKKKKLKRKWKKKKKKKYTILFYI